MTDDIVTRLRGETPKQESPCTCAWADCEICRSIILSAKEAADEIERLRNALEQCIFERDTWRNLYDKERGSADYIGDDRYLHEPAGEVPKGKTTRL